MRDFTDTVMMINSNEKKVAGRSISNQSGRQKSFSMAAVNCQKISVQN